MGAKPDLEKVEVTRGGGGGDRTRGGGGGDLFGFGLDGRG